MKLEMTGIKRTTNIPNIETAVDAYNFADDNLKVFAKVINKNGRTFNKFRDHVRLGSLLIVAGAFIWYASLDCRIKKLEEAQKEE